MGQGAHGFLNSDALGRFRGEFLSAARAKRNPDCNLLFFF